MRAARWKLLAAGVVLLVSCCAIMSFAKAEIREPSHSLRDDHWDQASTHSWFDVGHVQRPIKQLEDLELDEWEWSKAFRLHAGSGAAQNSKGADMPEKVGGIIQKWSGMAKIKGGAKGIVQSWTLHDTAAKVEKEAMTFYGKSKTPDGELDYCQILFTSDWAAIYYYSENHQLVPMVFLLDGLIIHQHMNQKMSWPLPGKPKGYYMIKPRSQLSKYMQTTLDTKERAVMAQSVHKIAQGLKAMAKANSLPQA